MANITRNFIAGRMNKVVDERLIPDGEYVDALNIRMGSTEKSEIGVIENSKGNIALTALKYIDGTPLSPSARCIGAIEDSANETIYWFVHDSAFPVGATGKLDLIVSFNVYTGILTYHIVSIDDGGGTNTTLNFNPQYLITGVDLIDKLIYFTDNYNPPRFFNVTKNYPDPIGNIDQFTAESILVIKKPPIESPAVQPITTGQQDNFMEDRFICFAYRYRYADGEYSATSQWSAPAFQPNPFEFSINSYLNEGMVNLNNTAIIAYNTGGPLVVGIDLLFKEAQSNIIKVIEKLNKAELGLSDNTNYTYTFTNSKIFTVLPESELLRLYDNVPLLARAQTIMGNRLMYGNYVEGYNLVDDNGNPVKFEYEANLISEIIDSTSIPDSTGTGTYSFGSPQTIPNSVVYIDLTGVDLIEGSSITVELRLTHQSFAGSTPFPTETSQNISATFSFALPTSYASVYALATSVEFQDAVGTVANIQPVANSCNGTTFTDQINCALPNNLDALIKYQSGISAAGQPIGIITTPASQLIGFQMPTMRYVDNTTTPTFNVYEYYSVTFAEAFYQKINSPRSLHSNRGYEIGIVYMDEFNRASTALVSPNNTVHVPCSASDTKNSIQVTIPATQKAPFWAKRYKFVIKPDEENYDVIYSSIFFNDPLSNNAYFLLEGENARKIETGDRLIVKADTSGPTNSCVYATVLEKESKAAGFIEIPSELDPNVNIPVPSGVYMKINPNNFAVVQDELSVIAPGTVQVDENNAGDYPILAYDMNRYDTATTAWVDYTVPAGSRIKLSFKFQRLGVGSGNGACERRIYTLEKTLISSANYDNMKDWWDGDNVAQILDDGVQEVGAGGGTIENEYIATLATSPTDIPTAVGTNYYRFYRDGATNKLSLLMSGTVRCGGVLSREKRRSTIIANVEVFRAETTLIFETEPSDALPDVFFENNLSFGIDANGNHMGNVQDQDIALGQPAIVNTEFFNCFCFGNGAESYKIRDSIVGKTFNLGNRVTSVSAQDYKRAHRFADITYSGVYNFESNVNKLNEFNLGLLNYKYLEVSFGPIYKLDGRETDVLTLQEDKISYVLAGKNLLSDSAAGGAITSVPEVLGTQIARVEKYGISFNPESYVQWGYDRYFTDVKRGAVIQLKGNSYSTDQLRVVSESGMRTWFRDNFIESFNTQKLGGYDPYMNEYVLTTNTEELPTPQECLACGIAQTFTIAAGDSVTYCVDLGVVVGESTISYSVEDGSTAQFEVEAVYNNIVVTSGITDESGSILVDKTLNSLNEVQVTIMATDNVTITVNVQCPFAEQITIVQVCVTSAPDSGQFIHNEYRYSDEEYVSPLQSTLIEFGSGPTSPIISQYTMTTGYPGTGGFPTVDSILRMASNKIGFDDFVFETGSDKFRYLRTNTLYNNNVAEISNLISASVPVTTSGSGTYYYGDFNVPSTGQYLYLIWDYRNSLPLELCVSPVSSTDACCSCGPSGEAVTLCYSDVDIFSACCTCSFGPLPTLVTFEGCYTEDETTGRYFSFRASEIVEVDIDINFTVFADVPYTGTATIHAGNRDSTLSNDIVGPSPFPNIVTITSVFAYGTPDQRYKLGECIVSQDCSTLSPPLCPDGVLVFQICNSNSAKDDNYDVYLNDVYIGALDLSQNAQVGSVFIASLDPDLQISAPDFVCPLNLIQTYRFDPSIVQQNNVLEMRNTQLNNNGNYGIVGVRNYQVSGNDLISPCTVANFVYSGDDGASFTFNFPYEACCPILPAQAEFDITTNLNNTQVYVYAGQLFSGLTTVVDWGDGSPTTSGGYHTYATAGSYTITISVNDRFNVRYISIYDLGAGYTFSVEAIRGLNDFTTLNELNLNNLAFDINTMDKPLNLTELYIYYCQESTIDLTEFSLLLYLEVERSTTLTSINASGLTNLDYLSIYNIPLLTSVDVSGLIYMRYFYLGLCVSLTTCPNLLTLLNIEELEIYNTGITTISIPPVVTLRYFYLVNNAINQVGVDNVLVTSDVSGINNGYINMSGGTNATPSATGLAAKANLITKGWNVITN